MSAGENGIWYYFEQVKRPDGTLIERAVVTDAFSSNHGMIDGHTQINGVDTYPKPLFYEEKCMTKILIAMFVVLLSYQISVQGGELSKLDKAMTGYEQRFQKPFPISSCFTDSKKIERIEKAINADVAYITKEEDAELKKMLRLEYQKKYARPITDFELTIARVRFKQDQPKDNSIVQIPFRYDGIDISITRTTTGAIVKDATKGDTLKAEINMDEWLDIIYALHRYRVNEWSRWEQRLSDSIAKLPNRSDLLTFEMLFSNSDIYVWGWKIELFSLDKDGHCVGDIRKFRVDGSSRSFPPNWDLVRNLMSKTAAKAERNPKLQGDENIESK